MPHHENVTVTGVITHLFGHRFVVETGDGAILADLTPHGEDQIELRLDDKVTLTGEMKPTELKVSRLKRGRTTIEIEHHHKHHHDHHHEPADPKVAVKAVKAEGFKVLGLPRRKPKHFEVLGLKKGKVSELHVDLSGDIYKQKPVGKDDDKWSQELRAAG